ncbi:MAG: hypothetical protein GY838_16930 [bacterium]|nr:hypothetical protein [bacterium]
MRRSLPNRWLCHLPLALALLLLGLYALDIGIDSGSGQRRFQVLFLVSLGPIASILLVVQSVVWLRLAAGRFGWLRTLLVVALLLAIVPGWRWFSNLLAARGTFRETLVAANDLYRPQIGDRMFIASADARWLVFARNSRTFPSSVAPQPEIVVRDLAERREQVVQTNDVKKSRTLTVAEEIAMDMDRVRWGNDEAAFERGRGSLLGIDLAAARARVRTARPEDTIIPPRHAASDHLKEFPTGLRRQRATTWNGEAFGRFAFATRTFGPDRRRLAVLERSAGDGDWETLATHRGLLEDWFLGKPVISPDERLVAYVAIRKNRVASTLMAMMPLLGMARAPSTDLLFVHDVLTGRRYRFGEVHDPSSLQWSPEGRHLYFAQLDPRHERTIEVIRFDLPLSPPDPARKPWTPPQERRSRSVFVSDPHAGWARDGLPGVDFRYPAERITVNAVEDGTRLLSIPATDAGASDETLVKLEVVPGNCLDLAPRGWRRARMPGLSMGCVLNRSPRGSVVEAGVRMDRWWVPLGEDRTLIVTRPALRTQAANLLFAQVVDSIAIP